MALVLAIAGLIFLVVFLALPALQNSQKDAARKQDVGRVVSALQSYEADHNGDLSTLAPGGVMADYSSEGTSTYGLSGYIGKLSQYADINVRGDSSGHNELGASDMDWIKAHPNRTMYVSIGSACSSGSSGYGMSISTDASVYALLSNGTVYCASM